MDRQTIQDALNFISPDIPRDEWVKIGCAIKNALNGDGYDIFTDWSRGAHNYNQQDAKDTWNSIHVNGGITVGTIFYMAKQGGWAPPKTSTLEPSSKAATRYNLEEYERKEALKRRMALTKAQEVLRVAEQANPEHPYLAKKGITNTTGVFQCSMDTCTAILGYIPKARDVALSGTLLVLRIVGESGLQSLEFIDENGVKTALAKGKKKGGFWASKPLPENVEGVIYVAEGFATICSISKALAADDKNLYIASLSAVNLLVVAQYLRTRYESTTVVIIGDIGNGAEKATLAARSIPNAKAIFPDFAGQKAKEHDTDFNDLERLAGVAEVRVQLAALSKITPKDIATRTNNYNELVPYFKHVSSTGTALTTIENLEQLLEFYHITLEYDVLLKRQTITLGKQAEEGNSAIARIKSLLAYNQMATKAIDLFPALFAKRKINPVMNWIESKEWDGTDRLEYLYSSLLVATEIERYRDLVVRTWLLQCIAALDGAVRTPNKKAIPKYELVMVLQGNQGANKTSWFKQLLPSALARYIIDGMHLNPTDRDSVILTLASWLCELGELDATFKKADNARIKAFLSKQVDRFRLPYDRVETELPRQTSYCGTVNPARFLNDPTGSRRFLPISVERCITDHELDMQQLWAQILHLYLLGEQWWCTPELDELSRKVNTQYQETEPVEEMISEIFDIEDPVFKSNYGFEHITITKILRLCGIEEPKKHQVSAANEYLIALGFKSVQKNGTKGYYIKRKFI